MVQRWGTASILSRVVMKTFSNPILTQGFNKTGYNKFATASNVLCSAFSWSQSLIPLFSNPHVKVIKAPAYNDINLLFPLTWILLV